MGITKRSGEIANSQLVQGDRAFELFERPASAMRVRDFSYADYSSLPPQQVSHLIVVALDQRVAAFAAHGLAQRREVHLF